MKTTASLVLVLLAGCGAAQAPAPGAIGWTLRPPSSAALARTEVVAATAGFLDAQPFLSLSMNMDRPLTLRVNEALVAAVGSAVEAGRLLHPGANTVVVTDGALLPWEAQVVLPELSLGATLSGNLKVGAPFELRWRDDGWATQYDLNISQARGDHFTPQASPFVAQMPDVFGPSTLVTLTATLGAGTFGIVTVSQSLSVPVAPR